MKNDPSYRIHSPLSPRNDSDLRSAASKALENALLPNAVTTVTSFVDELAAVLAHDAERIDVLRKQANANAAKFNLSFYHNLFVHFDSTSYVAIAEQ